MNPMPDYKNSDMLLAISEYIHNERHRKILQLRLCDGLTYEQIAERVDRSTRSVAYIISKEAPKLKALLR